MTGFRNHVKENNPNLIREWRAADLALEQGNNALPEPVEGDWLEAMVAIIYHIDLAVFFEYFEHFSLIFWPVWDRLLWLIMQSIYQDAGLIAPGLVAAQEKK
jgi:hypothetical protein